MSHMIDYTTQKYSYTNTSNLKVSSGVTAEAVGIYVETDGSTATVYGRIQTIANNAVETEAYVETPLRPANRIEISPVGIVYGMNSSGKMNGNIAVGSIIITTDGKVIFRSINWLDSTSNNRCVSVVFPTKVYLK